MQSRARAAINQAVSYSGDDPAKNRRIHFFGHNDFPADDLTQVGGYAPAPLVIERDSGHDLGSGDS